jgi:hypothetical protein
VTVTLGPLVVDAVQPRAVESFRAAALCGPAQHGVLSFRQQRRAKTVRNRVHLDVFARDVEPLLEQGTRVLAEYRPQRVTLADVEGLTWKFVRVHDERVVPNRWRWTVRADPADVGVRVVPQGNEFSAVSLRRPTD